MLPGEPVRMDIAALCSPPPPVGGGTGSALPRSGPGDPAGVEGHVVYDLDANYGAPQPMDGGAA
eukprot:5272780-Alexandrium_andersonii.AAC.1